ncbi:MAG: hypothetical protein COT18_09665 [Elusimicrobia bacterium CG08_land_8_20_14_0_20_59_10]|nr:MAG: hypothetical protein COT18_09665 [Elusimicrobia bacterium CG08_land_8_20_14_0_20_59_10]
MKKNYYKILQVQPDAHPAIIKTAYRTMMQELKMHPDLGGDNARAQELNEAHEVLSDPEKRRAYDLALPAPASGPGEYAAGALLPSGAQKNVLARVLAVVLVLLLAAVVAIVYYGRDKEPVWIGGDSAYPVVEAGEGGK